MTTPSVERVKAAIIAELLRQTEKSGCTTETNGRYIQVDGSFKLEPLARAVIAALGERPIRDQANQGREMGKRVLKTDLGCGSVNIQT